jgi:hypothetical protein
MPNLKTEADLDFDFPSAMRRRHHEGKGCLSEPNLFSLLFELSARRFMGRLLLQGKDKAETIFLFKDGKLVGADRRPMEETQSIGYLLRRAGRITESDFRELRRSREETKKSDQELLSGKVDVREIGIILVEVIRKVLARIASIRPIHYKIEEGAQHLAGLAPVVINLKRAIFRAMVDAAAQCKSEDLLSGLEPYMHHFVIRAESPPFGLMDLKLEKDEQRFWNVTLEKPIRLRQLFSVSALSKLQSIRIIYGMAFLGFVDFSTQGIEDELNIIPYMTRTVNELEDSNHFDVLQVHWTALKPAIDTAYAKVKKEWERIQIPPSQKAAAQALLAKILAKLDASHVHLSDDDRRRVVRDQIIEPSRREFTAEIMAEHCRSDLFRGNPVQARYYIEMAVDLAPRNQEYRSLYKQAGGR